MLIVGSLFFVAAAVSIAFCFIHCVQANEWGDEILAIVYGFLHLIIVFAGAMFVIRMMMKKKSMIMRTLMFYADAQKVPSNFAKNLCIVLGVIFLTLGVYFCIVFFNPSSGLLGAGFPYSLRLILINVCFYVVYLTAFFFAFPFLYMRQEYKYD